VLDGDEGSLQKKVAEYGFSFALSFKVWLCNVPGWLTLIDIPDVVGDEPVVESKGVLWMVLDDLAIFEGDDEMMNIGKVGR